MEGGDRGGGSFGGVPVDEGYHSFPADEVCAGFESTLKKGRYPGFVACGFTGDAALDRCVFSCARGKSDLKRGTAMGPDTIVRLYSMTKAFISVGVLRMADRGLLGLDDPVYRHLPEPTASKFREAKVAKEGGDCPEEVQSHITIRQLLTHTSGIGSDIAPGLDALTRKRNRWNRLYQDITAAVDEGRIRTLQSFVEALSELPLWQHPGREFYYSYGYDVLGYVLETISGLPLDAFLRKEVFEPLGLRDTGFAVSKASASRVARLYRHTKACRYGADGARPQLRPVGSRFVEARRCRVLSGGGSVSNCYGGLTSTMRDYAKFLVCVFNQGAIPGSRRRLLSKASAAKLLQNHCALVGGLRPNGRPRISAHNRVGVGLNLLGEVQLPGLTADPKNAWFDGVPGLVQWGGAASTFYKFQRVKGRPLLLIFFTQVLPQDDGQTCSSAFIRMREWAESLPRCKAAAAVARPAAGSRKRKRATSRG